MMRVVSAQQRHSHQQTLRCDARDVAIDTHHYIRRIKEGRENILGGDPVEENRTLDKIPLTPRTL